MKKRLKIPLYAYVAAGAAVFLFAGFFVLLFFMSPSEVYVYPQNPKQGDTIFIRLKSQSDKISGKLIPVNGGEAKPILFFKKDGGEWISLFGVDADQTPGDYKISLLSGAGPAEKDIKVAEAHFLSAPSPSAAKTGISADTAVNNVRKSDNPALQKVLDKLTEAPYFTASFSDPLQKIKQSGYAFGEFIGSGQSKIQHMGTDLSAVKMTKVFAINSGKVVAILDLVNYGKTVIIDHGFDIFSLYLHLDRFEVAEGQVVVRGQEIGLSGQTGYATAPHLHFSVRVGGARVDPVEFIEVSQKLNENFLVADLAAGFKNFINFLQNK